MKRFLLFFMILAAAVSSQAQVRAIGAIQEARAKGTNESTRIRVPVARDKAARESALYADVVRCGMWYVGVGEPLTAAAARRLPVYFKLSMRNKQGHWQLIQAMQGDRMTTAHHVSPYVLDKDAAADSSAYEWQRKLRTVAQWMLTPGLDGDEVVEERAYTAGGDMVYSFVPVRNADGRVTGTYGDALGLPVDMRPDSTTVYGSVVWLTLDSLGRAETIDFLDGNGMRKYSSMGVDRETLVYDKAGRLAGRTMHNMVGDYMADRLGNAGYRYVYDDRGVPVDTLTYTRDTVGRLRDDCR